MAAKPEGISRVQFAYHPGGPYPNHCGYCHGTKDSFVADGVWSEDMTVQDFQDLVDRGCQRSGKFVYLPRNKITCCPQYVMRLDSNTFRISKQQRRVVRRFKEYLKTGHITGMPNDDGNNLPNPAGVLETTKGVDTKTEVSECEPKSLADTGQSPKEVDKDETPKEKWKKEVKRGPGPDPERPKCRKAKVIRREKRAKKKELSRYRQAGSDKITSPSPVPMEAQKQATDMSLELALPDNLDNWKHRFTVKLVCVNPQCDEYRRTFRQSYEVFRKFQTIIHKEPDEKCRTEHFAQFCVDSPLIQESCNIPGVNYGSYHQQYWIDDTLVMVGVLDFLPQGVLCNYLYYDPHYRFIAPGVFSALYEIAQTQEYAKTDPQMQFYYMGYYVHDCPKMNYKRFYDSSYVLCPETLRYVLLPDCRSKMDDSKYCRFGPVTAKEVELPVNKREDDEEEIKHEDSDGEEKRLMHDLGQVLVFNYPYREIIRYEDFVRSRGSHLNDLVRQYVEMVGNGLAGRMLLYFQGLVPMF